MRDYLKYKLKTTRSFKRMSGSGVFGKYKTQAVAYIRYSKSELEEKIAKALEEVPALNNLQVEKTIEPSYKWLLKREGLKDEWEYIANLESREKEFENKKDIYQVAVAVHFLKYVLINKMIETLLSGIVIYHRRGIDISKVKLKGLGIDKSVLRFFEGLSTLCEKTIDEWLDYKGEVVELKYYMSGMKRVMLILIGDERGSI